MEKFLTTIYAHQNKCSKEEFIARMRKAKMIYLLILNSPHLGHLQQNLYVASNDIELLNKMATNADSMSICDFSLCHIQTIKPAKENESKIISKKNFIKEVKKKKISVKKNRK
jgi:hypothetical protein